MVKLSQLLPAQRTDRQSDLWCVRDPDHAKLRHIAMSWSHNSSSNQQVQWWCMWAAWHAEYHTVADDGKLSCPSLYLCKLFSPSPYVHNVMEAD